MDAAKSPPLDAGDVWTWTAICADTKLVPAWRLGDRSLDTAVPFIKDLAARMANQVQVTSDGHQPYLIAMPLAFGFEVDFAQQFGKGGPDNEPNGPLIVKGAPAPATRSGTT